MSRQTPADEFIDGVAEDVTPDEQPEPTQPAGPTYHCRVAYNGKNGIKARHITAQINPLTAQGILSIEQWLQNDETDPTLVIVNVIMLTA